MHETTQRMVCRAVVIAACVLPTLCVLAGVGWRFYPGRQAAEFARWGQRLGVVVECESWATPRPGEFTLTGATFRSGETKKILARCSRVTIVEGTVSAEVLDVLDAEAAGVRSIGRLLLARDLAPPAKLNIAELRLLNTGGAPQASWQNVRGELASIGSGELVTGRRIELTAANGAQLLIERNRQLDSIGTHCVVETGGQAVGAAWLADVGPLCGTGAFTGQCEAYAAGEAWLEGQLRGNWVGVDLSASPLTRQFAALTTVNLGIEKLTWRRDRIAELHATVLAGAGSVSRDLIRALYASCDCYPSQALSDEVNDESRESQLVAFDQLGFAIRLDATGIALSGACGVTSGKSDGAIAHAILARGGERLLDEPRQKLIALAECVQLLGPTSPVLLPATSDAIELASYLPLSEAPRPVQPAEQTWR